MAETRKRALEWRPAPAPQDGTEFWGWRGIDGIRRARFVSAADYVERNNKEGEPEDYEDGYSDVDDDDDVWTPKWWLPIDAIPEPPAAATTQGETAP